MATYFQTNLTSPRNWIYPAVFAVAFALIYVIIQVFVIGDVTTAGVANYTGYVIGWAICMACLGLLVGLVFSNESRWYWAVAIIAGLTFAFAMIMIGISKNDTNSAALFGTVVFLSAILLVIFV